MYVIKIKNKNLFYNNRNKVQGFYPDIEQADFYNSEKGANIALRSFKYWYDLGLKDKTWKKSYHVDISNFQTDIEVRKVKVKLI